MNRSGLLALVRGMRAYLEANSFQVPVRVGWNVRNRIDNQGPGGGNRIILVPGEFDPSSGVPRAQRAGLIDRDAPQNHVELDPQVRALAWWHEAITCSVWAVDAEKPQDEEHQISATETLLELTVQAIHNAVDPETMTPVGFGNLQGWGQAVWTLPPGEMGFGRELTFGFTLLVPLFDAAIGLAHPQPAVSRVPAS